MNASFARTWTQDFERTDSMEEENQEDKYRIRNFVFVFLFSFSMQVRDEFRREYDPGRGGFAGTIQD